MSSRASDTLRSAPLSSVNYYFFPSFFFYSSVIDPTTGSADDWLTEGAGVWGWCIELPNLITFQLPPSEIIPTGEHIWVAFKYFAEQVWLNAPANKK